MESDQPKITRQHERNVPIQKTIFCQNNIIIASYRIFKKPAKIYDRQRERRYSGNSVIHNSIPRIMIIASLALAVSNSGPKDLPGGTFRAQQFKNDTFAIRRFKKRITFMR